MNLKVSKVGAKIISKGPYKGVENDKSKQCKNMEDFEDQDVSLIKVYTYKIGFNI